MISLQISPKGSQEISAPKGVQVSSEAPSTKIIRNDHLMVCCHHRNWPVVCHGAGRGFRHPGISGNTWKQLWVSWLGEVVVLLQTSRDPLRHNTVFPLTKNTDKKTKCQRCKTMSYSDDPLKVYKQIEGFNKIYDKLCQSLSTTAK